jgi:hypothetical protein
MRCAPGPIANQSGTASVTGSSWLLCFSECLQEAGVSAARRAVLAVIFGNVSASDQYMPIPKSRRPGRDRRGRACRSGRAGFPRSGEHRLSKGRERIIWVNGLANALVLKRYGR